MLLPFGSRRVFLKRAIGRHIAIIGADGVGVSHSSNLICFSRPQAMVGPASLWHAVRGGGIGYRRVHQASMITSWAMPVSMA
jgi:hypothetical protein